MTTSGNALNIGMFGDSYISPTAYWIHDLAKKDSRYNIDVTGMGGANLYYAIHTWQERLRLNNDKIPYDVVIFTLTWHERLFSVYPYRNSQFCARSEFRQFEPDPVIQTPEDNLEFLRALDLYMQYIYDDHWRRFDHELEIRWIMDLPCDYPDTKFLIVPNTELSRELAKKYHRQGILMDMAFETVSNQEPDSPGPMPVADWRRHNHLNRRNHGVFADLMHEIICDYHKLSPAVLPIDLRRFDQVCHGD